MGCSYSRRVHELQERVLESSENYKKGRHKMKKPVTVALQPRVHSRLERFAARKNVGDLNLLLNVIVQDFLDTWDHTFTEEECRRWHEQAENLNWPQSNIVASEK